MIERLHRWLKSKLRATAIQQEENYEDGTGNWDDYIPIIEFHYNHTRNHMTGYSPFELVFGTDPFDPIAIKLRLNRGLLDIQVKNKDFKQYLMNLKELLNNKVLEANRRQDKYDSSRKSLYDRTHKTVTFNVNDLVMLYIGDRYTGNKKKLLSLYDGPFTVREVKNGVNYKISRTDDPDDIAVVHVSKLERYYETEEEYIKRGMNVPVNYKRPRSDIKTQLKN